MDRQKRERGGDDGTLTAQEIMGLDLSNSNLITLSACQTGLGELTGDESYDLERALKNAGAQTIIMSLWKVDDKATMKFMISFYDAIQKRTNKYDAFKKAQSVLRKEYSSPYYWGALLC